MQFLKSALAPFFIALLCPCLVHAQSSVLAPLDVFQMEHVSDPQVSPDGERVVFVRNFKDIMTDGNRSNLWMANVKNETIRPLTTGNHNDYAPLWSPDGERLLYLSRRDGSPQFYLRWLDSGAESKITNFTHPPSNPQWSPDGKQLAFTMSVPAKGATLANLPDKPEGAEWAAGPIYIEKMRYRADGFGYLKDQYTHIFVMSAQGGYAHQLTTGDFQHTGDFCWTPDGAYIIFSANRNEAAGSQPLNSDLFELEVKSGNIRRLTDRNGPDANPVVSPDGKYIAYTGFDDQYLGYQQDRLYVMDRDGQAKRSVLSDFDRNVSNIQWAGNGRGLYFQYDDEGNTKLAFVTLDGKIETLTGNVGGLSLGRPYSGGDFDVGGRDRIAFTHSTPTHPADLAIFRRGEQVRRLTEVNADLFRHKALGEVTAIWVNSSYDGARIQGWICTPPNFDPGKKYPSILEIHGGPFANYGDRFSAEVQLYAAAGYVVVYANPRGSTSYGADFGNLIHHNYPSQDYDDLMSIVDGVIEKGYVDEERLFVTGGSGGGVLTAWIVGKTDRFRAAVVAKPVINWYSFVLYADNPAFFYRYWFPGKPWEHLEHYMKRSPISLVDKVTTPTMLLTGEQDYRTPMAESEQYYAALKLNEVDAALVRIQEAGHGIARKPSNLIAKVAYVLGWFERFDK